MLRNYGRSLGNRKDAKTMSDPQKFNVAPDFDENRTMGLVKAELVSLRFFAGLTQEEAAQLLQISRATASRYWTYSRAWLYQHQPECMKPT